MDIFPFFGLKIKDLRVQRYIHLCVDGGLQYLYHVGAQDKQYFPDGSSKVVSSSNVKDEEMLGYKDMR